MIVVDAGDNAISVFSVDQTTGSLTPIGSEIAQPGGPLGVAFAPIVTVGNLFAAVVSEFSNFIAVYRVNTITGVTSLVNDFGTDSHPVAVAYSPVVSVSNVFLATANQSNGTISMFSSDPTTGNLTFIAQTSAGTNASSIAFSPLVPAVPTPNLFLATGNAGTNTVSVFTVNTSTGALTAVPGSPFTAGSGPLGVAFSPLISGNLFAAVTNGNDNTVSVYQVNTDVNTPNTGPAGLFTLVGTFATGTQPRGIAFSSVVSGNLFVALVNSVDNTVSVYTVNGSTGQLTPVVGSPFGTQRTPITPAFSDFTSGGQLFAAVTNFNGGNVSVYDVTTSNNTPSATITTLPQAICAGTSITLMANITGGVPPYTVTWSDGTVQTNQTSPVSYTVSPTVTTNYSITSLTDSTPCTGGPSNSVLITVNPLPVISLSPSSQIICLGSSATITGSITNGTGPYNVTWSDGDTQTGVTSPFTRTVSPSSTTTYQVTSIVDTATGCTGGASNTVMVEVDSPIATLSPATQTICAGSSATIQGTVTGGFGSFTITWSDGFVEPIGKNSFSRIVTPASTTTYSVTVSDTTPCTGPVSNTVQVNVTTVAPAITSGNQTICAGSSTTLTATITGGTPPYTVTWSDGTIQTNQTSSVSYLVSPAVTTNYNITSVIDSSSTPCTSGPSNTVTITVDSPTTTLSPATQVICAGGSATITGTISGGTGPYTITWSDGDIQTGVSSPFSRTVTPSSTTSYQVSSVTDSVLCTGGASNSVVVTIDSPSPSIAPLTQSICLGSSATITATISNGTGPYNVTWSDGFTQTGVNSPFTRTVNPSSTTTYTITTVTDSIPCTGGPSNSAQVTVDSVGAALTSSPQTICQGHSAILSGTITGGVSPYTIHWSDGVNQVVASSPFSRSVSPTITTNYSVTVSDSNSCSSSQSNAVLITVDSLNVSVTPPTQTICTGATINISASSSTGVQPLTYSWIGSNGFTANTQAISIANATTVNSGSYIVTVTDADLCQGNATATVTVNPIPTVVVTSSVTTIAPGQAATLTAIPTGTAPFTLTWSDGFVETNVTGVTTRVVHPTSTTTYSVVITDPAGCKSDPSVPITITVQSSAETSALSLALRLKYCPS